MHCIGKTPSVSTLLYYEEHKHYLFLSESPTLSLWYYFLKKRELQSTLVIADTLETSFSVRVSESP